MSTEKKTNYSLHSTPRRYLHHGKLKVGQWCRNVEDRDLITLLQSLHGHDKTAPVPMHHTLHRGQSKPTTVAVSSSSILLAGCSPGSSSLPSASSSLAQGMDLRVLSGSSASVGSGGGRVGAEGTAGNSLTTGTTYKDQQRQRSTVIDYIRQKCIKYSGTSKMWSLYRAATSLLRPPC